VAKKNKKRKKITYANSPSTGLQVVFREFMKDKLAMVSLILIVVVIIGIFLWAWLGIDQQQLLRVSLRDKFAEPGEKFLLGADQGGKDILGQIVVGAKIQWPLPLLLHLLQVSLVLQ